MPKTETYELSRELDVTTLARVGILRINQVMVLALEDDKIVSREFRVTLELAGSDTRTPLYEGTVEAIARGTYSGAWAVIDALATKADARAARRAEAKAAE